MPELFIWGYVALIGAAALVGFSKTAIGGLGSLAVVVFAAVLPARQSTGTLLPLLICGDVLAIWTYRRHANWGLIARLLPWIFGGLCLGAVFVAKVDNHVMRVSIGVLLLVLLGLQLATRRRALDESRALAVHHPLIAGTAGLATGFATMVANAAGPIATLYLLASGFGVIELVGAGAWLFFVVNLVKLPFSFGLGVLHPGSLLLDLALAPAVVAGALLGRRVIGRISRAQFERVVLGLVAVSAALLLV